MSGSMQDARYLLALSSANDDLEYSRIVNVNIGTYINDAQFRSAFPNESTSVSYLTRDHIARMLQDFLVDGHQFKFRAVDVCTFEAPPPARLQPYQHPDIEIILGDDIHDVLHAWNMGIVYACSSKVLFPVANHWLRNRVWWLPTSALSEKALGTLIASLLAKRYKIDPDVLRLQISSSSVSADGMNRFAESFKALLPRGTSVYPYTPHEFTKGSFQAPDDDDPHGLLRDRTLLQVPFIDNQYVFNVSAPTFAPVGLGNGSWMIDLELECPIEPNDRVMPRPLLRLPRREALLASILRAPGCSSRIKRNGQITCLMSGSSGPLELKLPNPIFLLRHQLEVLVKPDDHLSMRHVTTGLEVKGLSHAGRQLLSSIKLFGSLIDCTHYLADPFWRDLFLALSGGRRRDLEEKAGSLLRAESSGDGPDLERTARVIGQLLTESRAGSDRHNRWSLQRIKASHNEKKNQGLGIDLDWADREGQLTELLEKGVLVVGVERNCAGCGLWNWSTIGELATRHSCTGCQEQLALPLDRIDMKYTLNELLGSAIHLSGALPVLQTLSALSQHVSDMFLYCPSVDICESGSTDKLTDIDVVFIRSGRFGVAEVKTNASSFAKEDFSTLELLGRRIEPDDLWLAATEGDESSWIALKDQARTLSEKLSGAGTIVSVIKLDWYGHQRLFPAGA